MQNDSNTKNTNNNTNSNSKSSTTAVPLQPYALHQPQQQLHKTQIVGRKSLPMKRKKLSLTMIEQQQASAINTQ
jgi:hypothetical protein